MVPDNQNLGRGRSIASSCVAGAECVFDHAIYEKSEWTSNTLVLLYLGDTLKTAEQIFSLSGNVAVYNRNKERVDLDTSDKTGLIFPDGTSAEAVWEAYCKKFAVLKTAKKVKIKFGGAVHFKDSEDNILKTILRIEKIEKVDLH